MTDETVRERNRNYHIIFQQVSRRHFKLKFLGFIYLYIYIFKMARDVRLTAPKMFRNRIASDRQRERERERGRELTETTTTTTAATATKKIQPKTMRALIVIVNICGTGWMGGGGRAASYRGVELHSRSPLTVQTTHRSI